jgi:hypothetical protein
MGANFCRLLSFLAHLCWKLKWAILIAGCPSVRLSVNFYIFDFFSSTTRPILPRLGTDHLWGEGFQVCSNEGDCPSPRGDNSESVKIHWKFLKIFFSRTSGPNSIKHGTNFPWMKGVRLCSNKGTDPLQRGDNHKKYKNGMGSFKNLLQNHWANFNETWHKSSLGGMIPCLLK